MGVFGMFRHIAERKTKDIADSFGKPEMERVDRNLPLGIKIHCMIRLDETRFILAGDKLKVESPGGGTHTVTAAEKLMIGDSRIYRVYLESNENKNHSILQIPMDNNEISSITLYRIIDEIYPASDEEWDQWLNSENGLIGYRDFQISNDDGSVTEYVRLWGGQEDYAEPYSFESTIALDPYGTTGVRTESTGMIYGRDADNDLREYLLTEQQSVLDDKGEISESKIVLMAGIDLSQPEIEVMA